MMNAQRKFEREIHSQTSAAPLRVEHAKKGSRGVPLRTVSMLVLIFGFLSLGAYMAGRPPDAAFGSTVQASNDIGFHSLQTVVYEVKDLDAAVSWYSAVLGRRPYIQEARYAGFRVGDCELGFTLFERASAGRTPGSVSYWMVDDAHDVYRRLLKLGATANEPLREVGDGTLAGSVHDPFGNLIGVVQNLNELNK